MSICKKMQVVWKTIKKVCCIIICKCFYSEKSISQTLVLSLVNKIFHPYLCTCNSTKDQSSCVDINSCYDAHNNQVGLPNHAEGINTNIKPSLLQVVRQSGSWLDDQIIKTSMDILTNQYPMLRGFHNTLFGANLSFPITKPPFIQILHVHNDHWITVETVTINFVRVYDSLYNSTDISTQMQIAALIHTPDPVIELDIQQTQFQVGSSDCGLFSIAYATNLTYGNNPAAYRYKQELLRSHLK